MRLALVTSGYPLVSVVSMVGMGEIVTKEALEWAMSTPQLIKACSAIARVKDDIQSNKVCNNSKNQRGSCNNSSKTGTDLPGSTKYNKSAILIKTAPYPSRT